MWKSKTGYFQGDSSIQKLLGDQVLKTFDIILMFEIL